MAFPYKDIILLHGPDIYHYLSEGGGFTAFDGTFFGVRDSTYVGAPAARQVAGLAIQDTDVCVDYTGTSGAYISVYSGWTSLLNGADAVSFTVLFDAGTVTNMWLIDLRIDGTNPALRAGFSGSNLTVSARSQAADATQSANVSVTIPSRPIHFAAIANYTNDKLYAYIDGKEVLNASVAFGSNTLVMGSPTAPTGAIGSTLTNLTGKLDEPAIFSFGLSPAQISAQADIGVQSLTIDRKKPAFNTGYYSIPHLRI